MEKIPVRQITTTRDEIPSSGRFNIRRVRELLGREGLIQPLHKHDFFFVLALQKGAGIHEIDFNPYPVGDRSVFILRPGQVHQLSLSTGSTGFLMEFDTAFYHPNDKTAKHRLNKAGYKNACELEVIRFNKLLALLANIFEEYTSKQEGYLEVIKANLNIFFVEFVRQSPDRDALAKNNGSYAQDRLEDFLEMLGSRISSIRQVSQYANLMNLSVYQLNAITKSTVGKSASALINEQIILEAKRYLLATPNQVKDIADHLGYEDFSYFIRFFKKHTGYSPEVFRKNFQ